MFIQSSELNFNELKEKYPNALVKLKTWVKENIQEFQKVMAAQAVNEQVEIPEITDGIAEKATEAMLQTSTRDLYDFYDSQDIFISINKSGKFEGNIVKKDIIDSYFPPANEFDTRTQFELWAFKEAFNILEDKIKYNDKGKTD